MRLPLKNSLLDLALDIEVKKLKNHMLVAGNPLHKSNDNGCSQTHQEAYHLLLCRLVHKRQQYILLIPIFEGKPYEILGSRQTIMLSKHGEIPTCEGAMSSIR